MKLSIEHAPRAASRRERLHRYHRYRAQLSERAIAALLSIEPPRESAEDLIATLRRFGTQHIVFEPASFADIREIVNTLRLSRGDVVYDVGAGYGHFVCYGASVTPARFVAVELMAERCAAMRRSAARLGLDAIDVVCADAEAIAFPGASVLFVNSPFFPERAEAFVTRLAAAARWRPLRIVAMNNIVRHFRERRGFAEIETVARVPAYRFGLFRAR